jgi:hypothetical protein
MQTQFMMELNTKKVVKRFGSHPERGKVMAFVMPIKTPRPQKKFVSEKWVGNGQYRRSLIVERECDAFDSTYPIMQLFNRHGAWLITCPKRYEKDAKAWLRAYCS